VLRPELFVNLQLESPNYISYISPQVIQDDDLDSIDLAQSFMGQESKLRDVGSKGALLNMINARLEDIKTTENIKLSSALLSEAIRPSGILHMKIIPEAVHMLVINIYLSIVKCCCVLLRSVNQDNMTILSLDSHSITTFLHSRGINMQYLGIIYKLARLPHTKQMVLCEIVARASKKYLFMLMHDIILKARDATVNAVARGRSGKEEYLDHQANVQSDIVTSVVDFFNSILGSQVLLYFF